MVITLTAPILLTATVVVSFAASFGLSALIFRYVLGFAGTDQGVPLYAFILLAATFGVLALVPIVIMIEIGINVALGILLDTLVVRSILVPALSLDIGRWMWWPAPLGKAPPEPLSVRPGTPMTAPPAIR